MKVCMSTMSKDLTFSKLAIYETIQNTLLICSRSKNPILDGYKCKI